MTNDGVNLLPCPFCGAEAVLRDYTPYGFYVACNSVDCYAAVGEGYDRDAMPDHQFDSAERAAEAWNRRKK